MTRTRMVSSALLLCFLMLSFISLQGALAFALPGLVLVVALSTRSLPDWWFYILCAGEVVVLSVGAADTMQAALLQILLLGFVLGEAGLLSRLRDIAGFLAFSVTSWAFVAVTVSSGSVIIPFIVLVAVLALGYAAVQLQGYVAMRGLA